MYINKKLADMVSKWQNGTSIPSEAVGYVLRGYHCETYNENSNPFNVLLIRDLRIKNQLEAEQVLDFLYTNDIKTFVLADASTALMKSLVYLLNSSSYSINIVQGVTWRGSYNEEYGLVIEIVKKRKRIK